jgi:CheY-like chemotaxis protein
LEQDPEWIVCGEAENGKEAVDKVGALKPDIVLLDLQMPVMNGLEAARRIKVVAPNTTMLMFTMHCSPQVLQQARAAGIREVFSKTDHFVDIFCPPSGRPVLKKLTQDRQLPGPQAANSGRQINFQALRARTAKDPIIRKHNVAAVLTNQPPIGQDRHDMKLAIDDAKGTTGFFFFHFRSQFTA